MWTRDFLVDLCIVDMDVCIMSWYYVVLFVTTNHGTGLSMDCKYEVTGLYQYMIIPKWLFPPRFSDKNRFTSSRPDAVPSPRKPKSNRLLVAMKGGGFVEVAGGNWGRLGALQQHRQPPPTDPLSPDSTDPKISAFWRNGLCAVFPLWCSVSYGVYSLQYLFDFTTKWTSCWIYCRYLLVGTALGWWLLF